jgi:RNA polymerase-binding transcription factor DksA
MAKTSKKKPAKPAKKAAAKSKPAAKAKPAPKAKAKAPAKKAAPVKKAAPAKKVANKVVAKVAPKPAPKKEVAKAKEVPKKEKAPVVKSPAAEKKVVNEEVRAHKPAAAPLKLSPSQLNIFPIINQRPIAHPQAKNPNANEDKTRYSDEELKEFEVMINAKLDKAKEEFKILKDTLTRTNDAGTDSTSGGNTKVLEDGAETAEKENLSQLAARQQKYITNLENALVRIKNRTYGICSVTGKLISKERLIAVPHTTQSIEAKMMKQD